MKNAISMGSHPIARHHVFLNAARPPRNVKSVGVRPAHIARFFAQEIARGNRVVRGLLQADPQRRGRAGDEVVVGATKALLRQFSGFRLQATRAMEAQRQSFSWSAAHDQVVVLLPSCGLPWRLVLIQKPNSGVVGQVADSLFDQLASDGTATPQGPSLSRMRGP
jgi:hypothetical protein